MILANPEYNPGWEVIHDYHQEHCAQIEAEIKSLHKAMSEDYRYLEQLKQEVAFHHQVCLHCLETLQHKTTADYAAWLLYNFYQDMEGEFTLLVERLKSMQDVRNALRYLKN